MSRPSATPPTDHHADRSVPRPADQEAVGLPIAEAARWLGVSENAVRQRIKRGTVDACKVDGIWHVQVETAGVEHRPPGDRGPAGRLAVGPPGRADGRTDRPADHQVPAVPTAARAQLAAIVEEMIGPLVAAHEERTAALARDLGRVEAERDQARAERDELRARLAQAEAEVAAAMDAPVAAPDVPGSTEPAGAAPRPARGWWRRLFGG